MNNSTISTFDISGLQRYGVNEMNLLLLISFKCRSSKEPIVLLTFNELEKHAKIKNFSQFKSSYFEKLMQITWIKKGDESTSYYILLNKLEIDLENKTVSFYINSEIIDDISKISDSFSSYDLDFFLTIKSSYAKFAYLLTKNVKYS